LKKRISKSEYYLGIAESVAKRGICFRRFSGAIIVLEDQIVATGYTGAPRKTKDCFERDSCLRNDLNIPSGQRYELCRSVHAEMNAIINAARSGSKILSGDMYIYAYDNEKKKVLDAFPCFICKKILINAGLKRVICSKRDGGLRVFRVKKWALDWSREDVEIIDDKEQYGVPIKRGEFKERTKE